MEDQRILHFFIGTICDFSTPVQGLSIPVTYLSAPPQDLSELVDPLYAVPGQTNILDQIAEVEMQLPDNQVVQEEVETVPVLHQSEEIILDVIEAEETPFAEEESIEVTEDEVPWVDNEVIHYTDPAGNTFEAPVIPDPEDEDDILQAPEPETGDDAFEYKAEEANLDLIQEEKQETNDLADFDLDFVSNENEEDSGDIPDFF
jgi:hypothetical protein